MFFIKPTHKNKYAHSYLYLCLQRVTAMSFPGHLHFRIIPITGKTLVASHKITAKNQGASTEVNMEASVCFGYPVIHWEVDK